MNSQKISSEPLTDISSGGEPYPGWVVDILCQQMPVFNKDVHFLLKPAVGEEISEVLYLVWGWLEKKDPFTQENLFDDEEEQLQDLISRIRTSCISYRESLANRIVTLLNDAKEEEDLAGVGITADSLRNFYNFIQSHSNLKYPTISLTPEYNIYASWRVGQKQLFSVHFLPKGNTRFVIFKPNDLHPEQQIRISGITTGDILMETVAPYGVWDWISE